MVAVSSLGGFPFLDLLPEYKWVDIHNINALLVHLEYRLDDVDPEMHLMSIHAVQDKISVVKLQSKAVLPFGSLVPFI